MTELEVNLRQAFFRFREHNLNPQLKKCRFFCRNCRDWAMLLVMEPFVPYLKTTNPLIIYQIRRINRACNGFLEW
jgi:hypothetical protein